MSQSELGSFASPPFTGAVDLEGGDGADFGVHYGEPAPSDAGTVDSYRHSSYSDRKSDVSVVGHSADETETTARPDDSLISNNTTATSTSAVVSAGKSPSDAAMMYPSPEHQSRDTTAPMSPVSPSLVRVDSDQSATESSRVRFSDSTKKEDYVSNTCITIVSCV